MEDYRTDPGDRRCQGGDPTTSNSSSGLQSLNAAENTCAVADLCRSAEEANPPQWRSPKGEFGMWNKVYNPFGNAALSAGCRGITRGHADCPHHFKQGEGAYCRHRPLAVANLVAIFIFTMPAGMSLRVTVLGAMTGFFPIGWIVLNVIFSIGSPSRRVRLRRAK
jgi:hypothetical protein